MLFRSYVSYYAMKTIVGKGFEGYLDALDILLAYDRVKRMEEAMDRVMSGKGYPGYDEDVKALKEYYEGAWRSDFEMDEDGCFPE